MTNKKIKPLKQEMNRLREEQLDKEKRALLQQPELKTLSPSNRCIRFKPIKQEDSSIEIYKVWIKNKKKHPDFKEEEHRYHVDKQGYGWINFSDPHAEEDFLRCLAAKDFNGSILVNDQCIAKCKNGRLIDPRTEKEFPEGAYAELVKQLNAGMAYKDIPSAQPRSPGASSLPLS